MTRAQVALLGIATAALLVAVGAPVASAASPEDGPIVRVELTLPADHGLDAHLETSEKEMVTLTLRRESQIATYEVPGEVNEAGLKVRFGRLGKIDVTFTPTRTLSSTDPSPECTGAPRTLREGIFTGTIDFTGERGYVRIAASEASGSMSVVSQWSCPEPTTPFAAAWVQALSSQTAEGDTDSASLYAINRGCSCFFGAGVHHRHSGGRSIFLGAKFEEREGMRIERGTQTLGPASAFDFDHEAGTASLHPPPPFSGQATFRQRPGRRELWRSTIRVPLLGAAPLRTGAPGYRVGLSREYQFD